MLTFDVVTLMCRQTRSADWDEQHKEMLKAPSYADAAKVFAQATTGTPKWYHAQLSGPTTALDKPVTEVSLVTVKRPENRAAVADILSRMPRVIGNPTGAFGPTRDDKNKYIAICGWESVEVCRCHADSWRARRVDANPS